jgi:hypothetical protein
MTSDKYAVIRWPANGSTLVVEHVNGNEKAAGDAARKVKAQFPNDDVAVFRRERTATHTVTVDLVGETIVGDSLLCEQHHVPGVPHE